MRYFLATQFTIIAFVIMLSSAYAETSVNVFLTTNIDKNCNDSRAEWKKWLKNKVPESCKLKIKNIDVFLEGGEMELLSGPNDDMLEIDFIFVAKYERAFPACMGALSSSAIFNDGNENISVANPKAVLVWNSESARELLGWIEDRILRYISGSCALITDSSGE